MWIGSIDNSMNSPGVVKFELDDKMNIINKEYLGFDRTESQNPKGKLPEHIIRFFAGNKKKGTAVPKIKQFLFYSDHIMEFLKDCEYVAFENYAFGGTGMLAHIGESTGILKRELYLRGIKVTTYPPTRIKIFATTKGNADKPMMCKQFLHDEIWEFPKSFYNDKKKCFKSPYEDIIDAYYICTLLHLELKLRFGYELMSNLQEHEIKVFNTVTKTEPVNILAKDFVFKQ